MKQPHKKPIAINVSLLTTGLLLSGTAFAITPLAQGYAVGANQAVPVVEGKAKEGSCGGAMAFEMMDTNKDGKVTPAECDAMHRARFKKMDTNGDGVLSREELISGTKSMHQPKGGDMKMDAAEGKCGEGKCGGKK